LKDDVYVVVPAYNEEAAITKTLSMLLSSGYRIVVVDDGSKDDTWNVVCKYPVYALRHPINLGQGAALQTGMSFALQQGAKIIVHFDADGQHRVEDIDTLIEPLRQGEVEDVLGSRFLRTQDIQAIPRARRTCCEVPGLSTG
jgi:glycosyltransferase involved in cell wall biosynthesis